MDQKHNEPKLVELFWYERKYYRKWAIRWLIAALLLVGAAVHFYLEYGAAGENLEVLFALSIFIIYCATATSYFFYVGRKKR